MPNEHIVYSRESTTMSDSWVDEISVGDRFMSTVLVRVRRNSGRGAVGISWERTGGSPLELLSSLRGALEFLDLTWGASDLDAVLSRFPGYLSTAARTILAKDGLIQFSDRVQPAFLSTADLQCRYWTTTAIHRHLAKPDEWESVGHWANSRGRAMYSTARVRSIEASPEFTVLLSRGLRRRDFTPDSADAVMERLRLTV